MDFMGPLPVADDLSECEQLHFRETLGVFPGDGFGAWTVIVPGEDFLAFVAVEMFQVGFGHRFGSVFSGGFVHHADLWLSEDARGWGHDVELVFAEFVAAEKNLILPIVQDVADTALDKGGGGAARAGVQHGNILVEPADKSFGLGFIAAGPAPLKSPGGQIIPARAAGGLGIGRDDRDARLDEVVPVPDAFGIALAHQENNGGGVRGAVVGQAFLPVFGKQSGPFRYGVDVVGQRQRDDIGSESVDDGAGLLAGATVRLLDGHAVVGLLFPMLGKSDVEVL